MSLSKPLSALRENIAALGVIDGLLYLLARALEKSSGGRARLFKYYFVAQPVPDKGAATDPNGALRVAMVDAKDPLVADFPRAPEVIRRRFGSGDLCFALTRNGGFAGYLWLALGRYQEDEVRCLYLLDPAHELAWDYDVYVVPELRLSRAFLRLWGAANSYMADRGIRWTVSRISAFNAASLASHRRLGIRHLVSALFLKMGPLQIALLGRRPFVHLSLRDDAFPVLKLGPPRR